MLGSPLFRMICLNGMSRGIGLDELAVQKFLKLVRAQAPRVPRVPLNVLFQNLLAGVFVVFQLLQEQEREDFHPMRVPVVLGDVRA